MYIKQIPYSMSCSMIEVHISLPEWSSRQIIQVSTADTFFEPGISQTQVTDCHQCEIIFHVPVSYTHLDVYKRQAVYGGEKEGVRSYIEKIGSELEDTMKMCGVSSLNEINRDCVFVG